MLVYVDVCWYMLMYVGLFWYLILMKFDEKMMYMQHNYIRPKIKSITVKRRCVYSVTGTFPMEFPMDFTLRRLVEPSTRPSDRVMGIREGDLLFVIGSDTEEECWNGQLLLAQHGTR